MAKAYATVADVEDIVGHPLNATDTARAQQLLEAATVAFDRETAQSFIDATPVVGEARQAAGADLWLRYYPVATVQSVRARAGTIGASTQTLAAGTEYDLVDAAAGRVRVGACPWGVGPDVFYAVDYTPLSVPVPLDVTEAVAHWVAALIERTTEGGPGNLDEVSVGMGEVTLRYHDTTGGTSGVPPAVDRTLARYRRAVWA